MLKDPSRAALLMFALSATTNAVAEPSKDPSLLACAEVVIDGANKVLGAKRKRSLERDEDETLEAFVATSFKAAAIDAVTPRSFWERATAGLSGSPNDPRGEWANCMANANLYEESKCDVLLLSPDEAVKNVNAARIFADMLMEQSGANGREEIAECLNALGFNPEP